MLQQLEFYKHRFEVLSCQEIILIDDDEITLLYNQNVLHKIYPNIPVRHFLTIESAMEHLVQAPHINRLVLLDLHIGSQTAFDFLSQVEAAHVDDLYIAILTSSSLSINKKVALMFDVVGAYLIKPLSNAHFTAMNKL